MSDEYLKRINKEAGGVDVVFDKEGGSAFLRFNGQIDTYNSSYIMHGFVDFVRWTECNTVILDLKGLHYVSSTGVGAFINLLKDMTKEKKSLKFMNVGSRVMDVLELLGFSKFFDIIKDDEIPKKVAPKPKKVQTKSIFPVVTKCPNCGKGFRIKKAGKYSCPACRKPFGVTRDGRTGRIK